MGTKMAVAFANLFMAEIETKLLNENKVWKRYIDDVFSLWDATGQDIELFIGQANTFHLTIKFTAEISDKEITKVRDSLKKLSLTSKLTSNQTS